MWRKFLACFIVLTAGVLFTYGGLVGESTISVLFGVSLTVFGLWFLAFKIDEIRSTWQDMTSIREILRD